MSENTRMADAEATVGFECQHCGMTEGLMDAVIRARKGCVHCGWSFGNFEEANERAFRLIGALADLDLAKDHADRHVASSVDNDHKRQFIEEIGQTLRELSTSSRRGGKWLEIVTAIADTIDAKLDEYDQEEEEGMARNAGYQIMVDHGVAEQFNALCERMGTTPEAALGTQIKEMLELDAMRNPPPASAAGTVSAAPTVFGGDGSGLVLGEEMTEDDDGEGNG